MYAKVFRGLFYGSLTAQPDPQLVLVCLLTHADADGNVELPVGVIGTLTGLGVERVGAALGVLEAPDPESRSGEMEGRRIEAYGPGRWTIVNYVKYRGIRHSEDRKEQNREAKRRSRLKKLSAVSADVSHGQPRSAQVEVEVEAEEEEKARGAVAPLRPPTPGGAEEIRAIIRGASKKFGIPKGGGGDWSKRAWEDARALAESREQANELMEFAGWVMKHHPVPQPVLVKMFRKILEDGIKNPFAYYSEDGNAYQALLGETAVQRAITEKQQHAADDRRFFGANG